MRHNAAHSTLFQSFPASLAWLRLLLALSLALGYLGVTVQPVSAATIHIFAGSIVGSETWTSGNVYRIWGNVRVEASGTLTIQGGTIVKFNEGVYLDVFGTLDLQGSAGNEVIFTSIRDDAAGGDTNGDLNGTLPALGNWDAIYLQNSAVVFDHAIVRYSTLGVNVYNQSGATLSPEIANNTFVDNGYGVLLTLTNSQGIAANIHDNDFTHNTFGVGVTATPAATGTALPLLTNNTFSNQIRYPLYLGGTAFPTYSGNTFTNNTHPAIALGGFFKSSGTWTVVNSMPFVVITNTNVISTAAITLPAGAVVKFDRGTYLAVQGELDLQSTAVTSPTVFTSFWDDEWAGDTNGDGVCDACTLEPQPGDWLALYLESDQTTFEYAVVRYAAKGLWVYNTTAANWTKPIANNQFDFNQTGLTLYSSGAGQITSPVTNNTFSNGENGFPIQLDGTAYPAYSGNTFTLNKHPAIGVQGQFKHSGTWPILNGMPYVVTGHTNLTTTQTLTLPAGLVLKFDSGKYLSADGTLNMQSTGATAPIVFTSYKDDSYGGDTNADGSVSKPARGDWEAVYLQGGTTAFDYARVQYADRGVSVYNTTGLTLTLPITSSYLTENNYGVYLYAGAGNIASEIRSNTFFSNTHGLGTATLDRHGDTSYPLLQNNTFDRHSGFPIYLGGSAFPTYVGNTFANSTHPAIGLGGWFMDSGTWTRVNNMPFVVAANTYITTPATVTVPVNSILKFDEGRYLEVFGNLDLASTGATPPIVFTSYKDDTQAGDTNADGSATTPARGDWDSIYLENSAIQFDYALVKYSTKGAQVYAGCGCTALSPAIANNTFQENVYGVFLYAGHNYITSPIQNNVFTSNTYGLGTGTNAEAGFTSLPHLQNNTFTQHSGFPIYLGGSAFPTYAGNTFSSNTHPAIALSGWFNAPGGTWPIINNMPYVVVGDVSINLFVPVTVPAGEVFKFDRDRYMHVFGTLDLQSTGATQPVVFTSYQDDTYAGDTNANGSATTPAAADWKTLWLYTSDSNIEHAVVKYATAGVGVFYDGPVNTNIFPRIANNLFTQNVVGALLAIGYDADLPGSGKGGITSEIANNQFMANGHGLATFAAQQSTGASLPTLTDNTFSNHSGFPIYLGGTAYPVYAGNLALSSANLPAASAVAAPALPEAALGVAVNRALKVVGQPASEGPQPATGAEIAAGNVFSDNTHPAIGLAGHFNATGTLVRVENMPYVINGNYPLFVGDVMPGPEATVGAGALVSLPPNTVIKLGSSRYLDVFGGLNLLGSDSNPVIFTSYYDDAHGGDSNADGAATSPARGDWRAVYLQSSGTVFDHAVVKYASEGVHIWYAGGPNTNVFPEIADSFFVENVVALSFRAGADGDITSLVHDNVFLNNSTHMRGTTGGGVGRLLMTVTNNDLYGSQAGPTGLEILSASSTVTGTLNWWGACSGPYHPSLNAGGQGTPVSNNVTFNPWHCAPTQGVSTYSVLGRVVDDNTPTPNPIGGVILRLGPNLTTTTGVDGFYTFNNLAFGTYTVTAELSGYTFFPPVRTVTLPDDATDINFVGHLGVGPDVLSVFLPLLQR